MIDSSSTLSGDPFIVTDKIIAAYRRVHKHFGCLLCGVQFNQNDIARFVFCNYPDSLFKHGNFFICNMCDDYGESKGARLCSKQTADEIASRKAADAIAARKARDLADSFKQRQELVNRLYRGRHE